MALPAFVRHLLWRRIWPRLTNAPLLRLQSFTTKLRLQRPVSPPPANFTRITPAHFMRRQSPFLTSNQARLCFVISRRFSSYSYSLYERKRAFLIAGATVLILWQFETVPYSSRWHLMLMPVSFERWLGELWFEEVKKKSKLLPSTDSRNVKMNRIATNILRALKQDIDRSEVCKGAITKHLKKFHWEIVVVEDWSVNAYCLPGGKIVVYTGLLDRFSRDDEIATVIGHEVGHCIARHHGETITKELVIAFFKSIICSLTNCDIHSLNELSEFVLTLPLSRSMEKEADYIGLLLMARGGYDPRVAPSVMTRLSSEESRWQTYMSTHPSGPQRAKLLAQGKVMTKAIKLYERERLPTH